MNFESKIKAGRGDSTGKIQMWVHGHVIFVLLLHGHFRQTLSVFRVRTSNTRLLNVERMCLPRNNRYPFVTEYICSLASANIIVIFRF